MSYMEDAGWGDTAEKFGPPPMPLGEAQPVPKDTQVPRVVVIVVSDPKQALSVLEDLL